jgi:predicted transcriptional regulator
MDPSTAIEALRTAGMTEKAIGALVGVGQPTINRIRHGDMTPNYVLGKALVDLAESMAGEEPAANAA